jgi:probable HAF family extracellular repeat protein
LNSEVSCWKFLSIFGAGCFITCQAFAQSYLITDLGIPTKAPGSASEAHGVNAHGSVVGTWWDGSSAKGDQYAFWYTNGITGDLGTIKAAGYNYAIAYAINDANQVVGQGTIPGAGSYDYHAFLYTNGVMADLDNTGQSWSSANAINQRGTIVGEFTTPLGLIHAFLYTNSSMQDLGTLSGGLNSSARGINDSGAIVGDSSDAAGNTLAFIYTNGVMNSLGTLGGNYSSARAINNAGVIVGESSLADGQTHAFIYSNGFMSDLGTLGGTNSSATGINNSGLIVGYALTTNEDAHAFSSDGKVLRDLQQTFSAPPGWTNIFLTLAYGVNERGEIAGGVNYITSGVTNYDAFLLSPPPFEILAPKVSTVSGKNHMQMNVQGIPGLRFVVLTSTNLMRWNAIVTNTLTTDSTNFVDSTFATNRNKFYRAMALP